MIRNNARRSAIFFALALLACRVPGAFAAEELVVSFDKPRSFAPQWPGGTLSEGQSEDLAWLQVVSDGQAGSVFVSNVRPLRPAIDATGKFVKVWLKIDDLERLGGMEFRLSSDRFAENHFAFAIPLYQDVDFNVVRAGVWTVLTFSFSQAIVVGNPDRSQINAAGWYLVDKGGGVPLTAHWGGLALVDVPAQGVVSITFDDGYDEHLLAARLMQDFQFRGTAYIIPSAIGQPGYLTRHQLVDLRDRYHWDVAAHHETPFTDMSRAELETAILGIKRFLARNHFGSGANHLAYPLGRQDPETVRPMVRKHFASARVAGAGPETLPPADPHLLRVVNVTNRTTPEAIGALAARARDNGDWLILMLHYLVEEPKHEIEYSITDFGRLLEAIAGTGIPVLPLSEVFAACGRWDMNANRAGGCSLPSQAASPSPAMPR